MKVLCAVAHGQVNFEQFERKDYRPGIFPRHGFRVALVLCIRSVVFLSKVGRVITLHIAHNAFPFCSIARVDLPSTSIPLWSLNPSMCRFELIGRIVLWCQSRPDLEHSSDIPHDPPPRLRLHPTTGKTSRCYMKSSCHYRASDRPSGHSQVNRNKRRDVI